MWEKYYSTTPLGMWRSGQKRKAMVTFVCVFVASIGINVVTYLLVGGKKARLK